VLLEKFNVLSPSNSKEGNRTREENKRGQQNDARRTPSASKQPASLSRLPPAQKDESWSKTRRKRGRYNDARRGGTLGPLLVRDSRIHLLRGNFTERTGRDSRKESVLGIS